MDVYMVVVVVAGGQGGGGQVFVPTIQTSVKFRDFEGLYLYLYLGCQQITFKLGNFTNFKTLFSLVSTVLS